MNTVLKYIPRKKTITTFYLNFLTKLNKLLYLTFNLTNYFYTPYIINIYTQYLKGYIFFTVENVES